ncbi:MAG: hypothetical protein KJ709_04430, partial [Nanoarchaeota archaeon]|nr:hypothetical protein [Nanoarchaeota archaeon]
MKQPSLPRRPPLLPPLSRRCCCLAQFFNSFRNLFILKFNLQVIMDYPKPLDTLNRFKGQIVSVDLRD